MHAHPDRLYGWIAVNPRAADACQEVAKWAGQPGWIGVKAHPFWHRYPVALLDEVAAYCSEKGMPLLLHLGADEGQGDFRYPPERHPRLKIVYAHAGVPFYGKLWEYAVNPTSSWTSPAGPTSANARGWTRSRLSASAGSLRNRRPVPAQRLRPDGAGHP